MPSKPLKAIKPMFLRDKWRILKGDLVQIMAGKSKGAVSVAYAKDPAVAACKSHHCDCQS